MNCIILPQAECLSTLNIKGFDQKSQEVEEYTDFP